MGFIQCAFILCVCIQMWLCVCVCECKAKKKKKITAIWIALWKLCVHWSKFFFFFEIFAFSFWLTNCACAYGCARVYVCMYECVFVQYISACFGRYSFHCRVFRIMHLMHAVCWLQQMTNYSLFVYLFICTSCAYLIRAHRFGM